ncbi:PP2C family protein-serine/threonine phosphatase [Streptomyces sp. NPDC057806]|uniref:PP2C family protein-serine/threonine phosphatase n=1 Tax=unclassified Streptomyces TaxID=2593676 RepID=UPI0036C2BE9B
MASTEQTQTLSTSVAADAVWTSVPSPVLIADRTRTVLHANAHATALFPGIAPGASLRTCVPAWLIKAHDDRTRASDPNTNIGAVVSGEVGDRSFEAHPTVQDDGSVVWWLVDDTDHRLAREALRMERERTAFLAEASNTLLSSLNLERCMDVTAHLAAEHLADAAVVIEPRRGRLLPAVSCLRGDAPQRSELGVDPADVPGLAEALQGFPPVPSRWIDPASAPAWLIPEDFGTVGSIVITPLPGHGVPAGALVLLRRSGEQAFSEGEEVFARLFAARAGAALSAARLYAEQSSLSQTLMRDLLPPTLRQVGGVEFAGGYRPSKDHERIGGDFYDVHPATTEGEASLAVLGDVCGKGLEAAVLTGKIRNTLHALLPMAGDHQRVLSLLNGALINSHHTRFATMVLASAVREAASVRLRVTSAGHPPGLIVRQDGTVQEVQSKGMLIGVLPEVRSTTVEATLLPGECCVLFTDGITEAKGGPLGDELFGDERLREALAQCAAMPAEAIVEHVQMLASQWLGGQPHDDMAVMVIAAPRTHHLSAVDGHTRGRFTA